MVTALHVAMNEDPMADFPKLIDLQKKNGLKFVEGKSHAKACAKFIDILADCVKEDLKGIIKSAPFFTIEFDGSQARKTNTDKELVYFKVVVSVFLCILVWFTKQF